MTAKYELLAQNAQEIKLIFFESEIGLADTSKTNCCNVTTF